MKFTTFVLTIMLVLGGLIFLGSRDQPGYDDHGLEAIADVEIRAEDNGYQAVAYLEADKNALLPSECDMHAVYAHIDLQAWDEEFVNDTITKNDIYIQNIIEATRYKSFAFPRDEDPTEFPNYVPFISVFKLLLLKSMAEAHSGNLDESIRLARDALVFSQRIKAEPTKPLIGSMIGLRLQSDVMRWLQLLVSNSNLTPSQRSRLQSVFSEVPTYQNDHFSRAFAAEFVLARDAMDQDLHADLPTRWREFLKKLQYRRDVFGDTVAFYPLQTPHEFLTMLFPKYYIHRNESLDRLAQYYAELSAQAPGYCSQQHFTETEDSGSEFGYLLRPNSAMTVWSLESAEFKQYFVRRCLGHFQAESVKTVAALLNYRAVTGALPSDLAALVPDYLPSVPIDAFSGKPLLYSEKKSILYSVGSDGIDNGGAIDANDLSDCHKSQSCVENPTVPIFLKTSAKTELEVANTDCGPEL